MGRVQAAYRRHRVLAILRLASAKVDHNNVRLLAIVLRGVDVREVCVCPSNPVQKCIVVANPAVRVAKPAITRTGHPVCAVRRVARAARIVHLPVVVTLAPVASCRVLTVIHAPASAIRRLVWWPMPRAGRPTVWGRVSLARHSARPVRIAARYRVVCLGRSAYRWLHCVAMASVQVVRLA
jgi:hypothetical protein